MIGRVVLDSEWGFPTLYFGAAILIALALLAVGDGRGPNAFANEVQGARHLLVEARTAGPEELVGIESALGTLDPEAVVRAERTTP